MKKFSRSVLPASSFSIMRKSPQLADDSSFEQIKSSIKSAIGVLTIEKTIEHINGIFVEKRVH